MGFSGISITSLLLILVIVVVIFGTKKLRNAGGDLGGAIKNFKTAMKDGDEDATTGAAKRPDDPQLHDDVGATRMNTDPADTTRSRKS